MQQITTRQRNRPLVVTLLATVFCLLVAACAGPSINVAAGYQAPGIPLHFSIIFSIHNDAVSVGGSVGLVTDIGTFSVGADVETNTELDSGETLLVIRHHMGDGVVDNAYSIATGEQIVVTVDGLTKIYVNNRRVLIDASKGNVNRIEVENAPIPAAAASQEPSLPSGSIQPLRTISVPGASISSLAWSPDGDLIAVGVAWGDPSQPPEVTNIYRVSTGRLVVAHAAPGNSLNDVSWSPNGQYIATVGGQCCIQIWNTLTGNTVNNVNILNEGPTAVSWSPDSSDIVASGDIPVVLNAFNGSQLSSCNAYPAFNVPAIWAPRGNLILSDDIIWNGLSGSQVRMFIGGAQEDFFQVSAWSPNGREIVSSEVEGPLVLWDPATGATIWSQPNEEFNAAGPDDLSWSPDGKYIAWASGNSSPEVAILDSDTGNSVDAIGTNYFNANYPTNDVVAVAWSPNGQYIATIDDGVVQIWNAPRQS